jgi:hypothetical protein
VEPEDHAAADVGPGVFDGRTETRKVNQWSVLSVVGVGEADAGGAHVEQALAVARYRLRHVDDVEDLGSPEAGDLHSWHVREARGTAARRSPLASVVGTRSVPR